MACRSASAQRAQKKSSEALKAIERLVKDVEKLAASEEADFQQKISKFKDQLETDDFKELAGDSATKVDFTHEFDADALTAVITNVLSAAATVISGTSAAVILTNPENIKTYTNLLSSIAEAIKTSSTTGASTSFSVSRLAPGFFACTMTKSMTVSDKETFGEESITATVVRYALYFSQKHAVEIAKWDRILSVISIIRKLNSARVGLVDRLLSGEYSIATFTTLSESYKVAIEKYESELAYLINESTVIDVVEKAKLQNDLIKNSSIPEMGDILYDQERAKKVLSTSIEVFGGRSSLYRPALIEAKALLTQVKKEM